MNSTDRNKLRPIVNRIQHNQRNISMEDNFACIYDDTNEINEPDVLISMVDFRTLCRLAGVTDTLTVPELPHKNSMKIYLPKDEKEN